MYCWKFFVTKLDSLKLFYDSAERQFREELEFYIRKTQLEW